MYPFPRQNIGRVRRNWPFHAGTFLVLTHPDSHRQVETQAGLQPAGDRPRRVLSRLARSMDGTTSRLTRDPQSFFFDVMEYVLMKRLLIRMSALAIVVVLGLIAIVQAQHGTDDSPQAANAADAPMLSVTGGSGALPIDAGNYPGLTGTNLPNPLRPEIPQAPPEAIQTSGLSTDLEPWQTDAAGGYSPPPGVGPSIGSSPPEAFSLRSAEGVIPGAAAPQNGSLYPPDTIPTAPPMGHPGDGASYYPDLTGPAGDPNSQIGAPVNQRVAAPTTDGYYTNTPSPADTAAEPAPFRLDPNAPSTSIPNSFADNSFPSARGSTSTGHFNSTSRTEPLNEGVGTPGNHTLEGTQTPQLTIEKFAPAEIQVGKPATFHVKIQNTGHIPAYNVEIHDDVPKGTRLVSTTPRASQGVRGELVWVLGTMQPGDEMTAQVQLMPVDEGEVGSVATLQFTADASVRTIATKPELVVEASAPGQVMIGEEVILTINISNPGSGTATGVIIEERVPPGMQHPAGAELEYEVGDLKPNESRQLQLPLRAERPGPTTNVLIARADSNLQTENQLEMEVIAPRIEVTVDGPKRRYLEREATYTLSISNPGTAPARRVSLVAQLPPGLDFVSANNAGHYDQTSRSVHWQLEELPVQETGEVILTTLPVEMGQQAIRVRGSTELGLAVEKELPVTIEGIAAILFEVVDVADPIEVGGETTYEIRVLNQGSKAASDVQLAVLIPPEMRPIAAEGPTRYAIDGNRVVFDGLSRLAPKADTTFRVRVQGLRPGDLRIRAQLTTDELRTPVTKEESTRVYSDE